LGFDDFASFIRRNSWVTEIELSNWGEIFLNKELVRILEHARDHAIAVTAGNGANLNTASDEVLEALVRYSLRKLTCSIDGASQETYSAYRKNGNFERVIRNIRKINRYKKQYGSTHPEMTWQFVAFGHNTHEIARARRMAERLDMRFKVKLSWDDLYTETFSPVADKGAVRREMGLGVADRDEYEEAYGRNYAGRTCWQLWSQPRINYDGRLLGCSINHWGDYGNVFEHGLEACLAGEKMTGAREMLMGRLPPQLDIPCSSCKIYHGMRSKGAWVEPPDSSRAHDGAGPSVPSETLIPRSSRGYKG